MNLLKQKWLQLRRRIRWALGKGWDLTDFSGRYDKESADAWSYTHDSAHLQRLKRILEMLAPLAGKRVLELGCAEGFITREIARQAENVVACDLSNVAVQRTRANCETLPVEVIEGDIRKTLPNAKFDLILASDVFYYLTRDELVHVTRSLAQRGNSDCKLVMANEWNSAYTQLNPPSLIIDTIQEDGRWNLEQQTVHLENNCSHTIAKFSVNVTEH